MATSQITYDGPGVEMIEMSVTTLSRPCRGFILNTAGTIEFTPPNNSTTVTLSSLSTGVIYPLRVKSVTSLGTAAGYFIF